MTRIAILSIAAIATLSTIAAVPAFAEDVKADWQLKTDNAYFSVYSHYCAPDFYGQAASPAAPSSLEIALYSDVFRAEYGSDCREFYLSEIAARIDPRRMETVVLAKK